MLLNYHDVLRMLKGMVSPEIEEGTTIEELSEFLALLRVAGWCNRRVVLELGSFVGNIFSASGPELVDFLREVIGSLRGLIEADVVSGKEVRKMLGV